MSARPQSVNDEMPIARRIRRDQFKRIKTIVDVNSKFPVIALGLVRDYLKGNPDIRSIYFDNPEAPTEIIVGTVSNNGLGGTEYHYRLSKPLRLESPSL
jgi:hypothetical protein